MKSLVFLIAGIVVLAYPLLIYLGVNRVGPGIFALVLLVMAAVRYRLSEQKNKKIQLLLLACVGVYSAAVALLDSTQALLFYPTVTNLGAALMFGLSLFERETIIERFAKMAGNEITENAKRYTWKLTLLWVCLLCTNAVFTAYSALFFSFDAWALYNGLLAYLIFGLFGGLEYIYRQYYIKKYGA